MKLNGKTIYAQSSDIKSRTYLEYRRDMKKKAIAELEVLEWLENKVKELHRGKLVKVYKSGGDKFLWFLRKGGVLEDLIQDMIHYYSVKDLEPVKKIYENVGDVEKTYKLIKGTK